MKVIHALVNNITINYLVIVLIMCVFFGTGRHHFCPWPILRQHFDGQTQFLGHLFALKLNCSCCRQLLFNFKPYRYQYLNSKSKLYLRNSIHPLNDLDPGTGIGIFCHRVPGLDYHYQFCRELSPRFFDSTEDYTKNLIDFSCITTVQGRKTVFLSLHGDE